MSSSPHPLLSIGELADRTGVRRSALRYYEDGGLIAPARRVSGRRRYQETTVGQVRLIRFCQQFGFSLGEIRELLQAPKGTKGKEHWREFVDAKLAEIEASIQRAKALKQVLKESRDCDCVSPESCQRLVGATSGDGNGGPPNARSAANRQVAGLRVG